MHMLKNVLFIFHNEWRSISCECLTSLIVYFICYLRVVFFQNTLKSENVENGKMSNFELKYFWQRSSPLFIMLYKFVRYKVGTICMPDMLICNSITFKGFKQKITLTYRSMSCKDWGQMRHCSFWINFSFVQCYKISSAAKYSLVYCIVKNNVVYTCRSI